MEESASTPATDLNFQSIELIYQPGQWQTEELHFDGDQYFQNLVSAIQTAQKSIDLEVYIFEPDAIGEKIMQALVAAAKRGVQVRVLVDGIGSPRWFSWFQRRWKCDNFKARVYRPLPWPFSDFALFRRPSWRNIMQFFTRINRRNHRKTCVIDKAVAFLGSFNISICHSFKIFGDHCWRDSGVRLVGDGINELSEAFEWTWRRARKPRWQEQILQARMPKRTRYFYSGLVRLNYFRTLRKQLLRDLLKRITQAQTRVWLTNPYFVPDRKLMRALVQAASRGTQVQVLVPRHSDVPLVRYASQALYGHLMSNGISIYEYLPAFLHAKTMIIDDWVTVGTTNLNHRSILHDMEVDAILGQPQSLTALVDKFQADLRQSEKLDFEKWKRRTWRQRLVERIALALKYWM